MKKAIHIEAGYAILQDATPEGLARKVGESIGLGWGLAGGPFVIPVAQPEIKGIVAAQVGLIWNQAVYQVIERELDEDELQKLREAAAKETSNLIT